VAKKAGQLGAVTGSDADTLMAAAWLHDVGYAAALAEEGFHPLDGARWLRRIGYDPRVTARVAHHSCAAIEAELRGLADELLAEFPWEESAVSDALRYFDLTTGPEGERMTVDGAAGGDQIAVRATDLNRWFDDVRAAAGHALASLA